jgi:hypothetical protein
VFEQSVRLYDGIGTRFNLADCWDKIGRTGRARDMFLEVADAASATGEWDREQAARQRAAAIAAPPAISATVEVPTLAIRGAAESADPAAVLEVECGSLAEASARVRTLQQSIAELKAGHADDPRLQKAERELGGLEAQLATTWSLAGHVATALASRSASTPDERSASVGKPSLVAKAAPFASPVESRPAPPAAGSVAALSTWGSGAVMEPVSVAKPVESRPAPPAANSVAATSTWGSGAQ